MAWIWRYRSSPGWACGRRMSAGLARELQIAGLLVGKNPARIGRHGAFVLQRACPASGFADRRPRSRWALLRRRGRRRPRSGTPTRLPSRSRAVCTTRSIAEATSAHMSDGQVDVRSSSRDARARDAPSWRGRSLPATGDRIGTLGQLARSPPGRGVSGRGTPFFVLADALEGEEPIPRRGLL
jgi:hypothetical protein